MVVTTVVLHRVEGIRWGRLMELSSGGVTRDLIFTTPEGEVRVEVFSAKPISITEATATLRAGVEDGEDEPYAD